MDTNPKELTIKCSYTKHLIVKDPARDWFLNVAHSEAEEMGAQLEKITPFLHQGLSAEELKEIVLYWGFGVFLPEAAKLRGEMHATVLDFSDSEVVCEQLVPLKEGEDQYYDFWSREPIEDKVAFLASAKLVREGDDGGFRDTVTGGHYESEDKAMFAAMRSRAATLIQLRGQHLGYRDAPSVVWFEYGSMARWGETVKEYTGMQVFYDHDSQEKPALVYVPQPKKDGDISDYSLHEVWVPLAYLMGKYR